MTEKSDYLKAAEGYAEGTREVLAETIREAANAEPYGVDDAKEIIRLLRRMNDAAKICEGKLLDDREPVGGTDAQ